MFGHRKTMEDEEKGSGSREVDFDAGMGRGSTAERCLGVFMAARMTWKMMMWPPGHIDGQWLGI